MIHRAPKDHGLPLRITIAAGPFFPTPPAPTGAVQRIWYDLAAEFAARGHHVTILAVRHGDQPREEVVGGVRIIRRLSMQQGRYIWLDLARDLFACLLSMPLLPKADILITNTFWMPVVARLRGSGVGKMYVSIARFPKGQMGLYRHCERLHAVSRAVATAIMEESPKSASRIRVIPNPIATDIFVPPVSRRATSDDPTILYTGRLHPEKGVHMLIEAFRILHTERPRLRLRIMGPISIGEGGGGEPYMAKLKLLAKGLPVEFASAVYGRQALAAELGRAHFYCYPSLADKGESFGVAPLEAMATGLPCLVSDLECFRDFVIPGENALVFNHRVPTATANLADELGRLVDDPSLCASLGAAAVVTSQRFSYVRVADQFIEDFRDLIKASRGDA